MPYFAVIGFDHPPHQMELRDKFRAEHRAYAEANGGTTRLAGALYDGQGNQCGTLKIFEAESADEVRNWYANEPFMNNGVYKELHIIEWKLARNELPQTNGWDKAYQASTGAKQD